MEVLTIPVSPKVAEVLKKSSASLAVLNEINVRLVEACSDGKITIEELLSLFVAVSKLARLLIKK